MNKLLWIQKPELEPFAGGQHQFIRQALVEAGWDICVCHYQPRTWRQVCNYDCLVWGFIPGQVDVWATRLFASHQVAVVHEYSSKQQTLPKLDGWFVPSRSLQQQLIDQGIASSKINLVQGYQPAAPDSSKTSSTPTIYVGGPLTGSSGIRLAVWALSILKYLQPHIRMVLHGSGPERENLEYFIESQGLTGSVDIVSDQFPVRALIEQADAVWLPRIEDGVPDAMWAALSAGKPILTAPQPSLLEWLHHEENALVLRHDNPPAWAAAMNRLLSDNLSRGKITQGARATQLPQSLKIDNMLQNLLHGHKQLAA